MSGGKAGEEVAFEVPAQLTLKFRDYLVKTSGKDFDWVRIHSKGDCKLSSRGDDGQNYWRYFYDVLRIWLSASEFFVVEVGFDDESEETTLFPGNKLEGASVKSLK